jgi:Uma2 family endonuclease
VSNAYADPAPDVPERMTWDELARLPEELARRIELHSGRVVFVRTGPPRHQRFYRRLANAIEQNARADMHAEPGHCWQVDVETNVFFNDDKSDFRTPDFLVYHRQDSGEHDIHAHDVVLAGEVLSPGNTHDAIEAKKAKYASADIPWYWEADLDSDAITAIRAYALELSTSLPDGVVPLRPRNYILIGQWTPAETSGIRTAHPFPIDIDWDALAF